MDFFEILKVLMVPNRDNGSYFTNTQRLEQIERLLWNSAYRDIGHGGLYALYARKPLGEIENPILVSTHVDCVNAMTELYTAECGDGLIRGTYDNGITNAAAVYLMRSGRLPENVLVAFTGDEEQESRGAQQLIRDLERRGKVPKATIVLDVTDMGWNEGADFTIENNFWDDGFGQRLIAAVEQVSDCWRFVPSDVDEIPGHIDRRYVIKEEADEDESWEYDEHDWQCFSLCLPTCGPMHSNFGVRARKNGCLKYIEILEKILWEMG